MLLNAQKSTLCIFTGFIRETGRRIRRQFSKLRISLHGNLLVAQKQVKFLGLTLQSNGRFCRHVDAVLTKAGRAYGALRPLLRSKLIEPKLRIGIYKMYIRPVITYAAPVWVRTVLLSSHQMERIRRFERGVIRVAGAVRRALGNSVYASNETLYELAGVRPIDELMVNHSIRFVERCHNSAIDKISNIVNNICGAIPDIANLWNADQADVLLTDGRLDLFDKSYDGTDRLVYGRRTPADSAS